MKKLGTGFEKPVLYPLFFTPEIGGRVCQFHHTTRLVSPRRLRFDMPKVSQEILILQTLFKKTLKTTQLSVLWGLSGDICQVCINLFFILS
jgi:hypothetical protein